MKALRKYECRPVVYACARMWCNESGDGALRFITTFTDTPCALMQLDPHTCSALPLNCYPLLHSAERHSAWQDRGLENLTGRAKLAAPDDTLVLEDASARMALRGDGCPAGPLVTGVVAAVRGAAAPGGDFDVKVCSHPSTLGCAIFSMAPVSIQTVLLACVAPRLNVRRRRRGLKMSLTAE